MGKKLVLAEKPSVGRDIARVLKCQKQNGSYIEGNEYVVTWAMGHLVGLADPEAYGNQYKTWSMETLPMLPSPMKLTVLKGTGKQFQVVKNLLLRKDITEIIIATDAGREGELVARWIIDKVGVKKPIQRLWISSVTDKAILEGFKNLKPGKQYENLYRAAVCRAESDWLVGLNVTRALTCKYNAQLSAGRVQSATLAMVVAREEAIKNFVPKPYFTVSARTSHFTLAYKAPQQKTLTNEQQVDALIEKLNGKMGEVIEVKESQKKQYAPGLYDLTELQRDANRFFGYSPKQTLSIMQRLYENHKVLTYPRTDSRYLSEDIVPTLKERLKAVAIGPYRTFASDIIKKGFKTSKSFVDNTKVSDHHAIIPTEESVQLQKLTLEERKIYDLVVKRFLSVLMAPCLYSQMQITVEAEGERFGAKGKNILEKGWKALYEQDEDQDEDEENSVSEGDKDQNLPKLQKGEKIKLVQVVKNKCFTKAPSRFTEATLLSAMEKPHQYVQVDQKAAKTLGETGGIGTVATRADIIEKLYNMFYIEKNGNAIIPTSKGKQLIELVPVDLKTPLLTAKWENELERISIGKQNPKAFMESIRKYSSDLVQDVKGSSEKYVHDNMTGKRCPNCGKFLLEVKGKHGKLYVCQDRECGYKETVSKFTNTRCPNCHKKLELRGEGEGQIYVCTTCTFREKLSSFNKKYRSNNQKVDKKSVQRYLKQQQKEDEGNFVFAEAFGSLFKKD